MEEAEKSKFQSPRNHNNTGEKFCNPHLKGKRCKFNDHDSLSVCTPLAEIEH